MTKDETLTHHLLWPELHLIADGDPAIATSDWKHVTCPECRLERPEDFTGRPEYRVPDHVKAADASLAEQDRVRQLVAIEKRMRSVAKEIAAIADVVTGLNGLSEPERVEKRLGVPVTTLAATDAAARLSEGARYYLRAGTSWSGPKPVREELRAAGVLDDRDVTTAFGRAVRKVLFEIS